MLALKKHCFPNMSFSAGIQNYCGTYCAIKIQLAGKNSVLDFYLRKMKVFKIFFKFWKETYFCKKDQNLSRYKFVCI